ncbi:MAG: HAD family hydrolase [Lachnospiraceae bacterium]|nr:HAD family hydrolase [Lachnospiraceae bacterium]
MNTIIFDLDGTLLPMEQDAFEDTFYKSLHHYFQGLGYESEALKNALENGMTAMLENNGFQSNREAFETVIDTAYGKKASKFFRDYKKYFRKDFDIARLNTRPIPDAPNCIRTLQTKGYSLVLASSPFLPEEAILKELDWAGLSRHDFLYIATYENSCYAKTNLQFYRSLPKKIGRTPGDCLVVGNDVAEDMCAVAVGFDVFLIKDCLVNRKELDYCDCKQGSFGSFLEYVDELPVASEADS